MKNYVVVGGTSGIGKAIVESLAGTDSTVYVLSRNATSSSLGDVQVNWDAENDAWPADQLPAEIHGLAYCPGSINLKGFRSLKPENFTEEFNINVIGAVNSIKGAMKAMSAAENASIVLFSTVAVQTGMPFHASIASAKGAVEGLTRSLAAELSPSIQVNAIAPSLVDTPLAGRLLSTPEKKAASEERHPLKKIGTPESVANLAVSLLNGNIDWATGQIFHLDGGMSSIRK